MDVNEILLRPVRGHWPLLAPCLHLPVIGVLGDHRRTHRPWRSRAPWRALPSRRTA